MASAAERTTEKVPGGLKYHVECPRCGTRYEYTVGERTDTFNSKCPGCSYRDDPGKE